MKSTIELLRELREDHDMKQSDVAEYIGTSQQHYSKYENGVYELPFRYFAKLADLYDVSADYLLGRTTRIKGKSFQNIQVTQDCSCSKLMDDILALSDDGRKSVIEYVAFLRAKEK